jgi:multidrug efflux pump subunit AcrB
MNLTRFALRRPLTILAIVLAVVGSAAFALVGMPRDVFPPLGVPTIYVAQPYGGMDPAQMEGSLTYFYEYHFLYITGIEHVESKSIQGAALMKLQFHPGTDMSQAMSETVAYVNRARAFMPPGTVPPFVMRFDAGSVPVGYLVFSSDNPGRTLGQMQDAALNIVRPMFATLPGVSAPPPFGGSARTVVVNVDPDRLHAYDLSPEDIVTAITRANVVSPSGNVAIGDSYPIVPVNAVVRNIHDLDALPVRTVAGRAVYLRDVATVADSTDIVTSYALANGHRTVYIPVTKRSDASTLSVVDLVKGAIPRFQAALPDDVRVSYEFDQSPVVRGAIGDLTREGLLGAVLTGVAILVFLSDWASALVVVVNIPLALLASCFGLAACGQSINLMTLGGLALSVGILVDEATVTIENIHAHLDRGAATARAALDATAETVLPRLLAMLCIVAVFLPAFFMTGAARALFVPMALAVAFSMVASYLLSSTLVPVLAVWLLSSTHAARASDQPWFHRLQQRFVAVLSRLLGRPALTAGVYLAAAFAVAVLVGSSLGSEIFPPADVGQLAIRFRAPSGTRVERTEEIAKKVLDLIASTAGAGNVRLSIGLVGVHSANYPVNLIHLWNAGPEEGWLAVQFADGFATWPLQEKLRSVFAEELPAVSFSFEPSDIVSRVMSFGANTPVEIAVSGPDLDVDKAFAGRIRDGLASVSSLRDVHFAQALDYPTIEVQVDRERAGLLGVHIDEVTRSLVAATASSRFTVANFWSDPASGVSYNIQVQVPQSRTTSMEDLRNIPVGRIGDVQTLLRSVADVHPSAAVETYERYNMVRTISLTANIEGADLGSVSRQLAGVLSGAGAPPPKTTVTLRGQAPILDELSRAFALGLAAATVAILLVLGANFQSFLSALVVLAAVPAALAGVAVALKVTGGTLNIESAVGAIMSVGVAVANAILLVTFAERNRRKNGDSRMAAQEAARDRLRPILMTSLAMSAGMLPMAFGIGQGGAQSAALGRAVLGGLLLATLSTLFAVPCVFAVVRRGAATTSPSLDPDDPESTHFDSAAAKEAR